MQCACNAAEECATAHRMLFICYYDLRGSRSLTQPSSIVCVWTWGCLLVTPYDTDAATSSSAVVAAVRKSDCMRPGIAQEWRSKPNTHSIPNIHPYVAYLLYMRTFCDAECACVSVGRSISVGSGQQIHTNNTHNPHAHAHAGTISVDFMCKTNLLRKMYTIP